MNSKCKVINVEITTTAISCNVIPSDTAWSLAVFLLLIQEHIATKRHGYQDDMTAQQATSSSSRTEMEKQEV